MGARPDCRALRAGARHRKRRPLPPRKAGAARDGRRAAAQPRAPLLCVPGNHDIPYTFPARFTRTYEQFERLWETTEPVYRSDRIVAVGLNSVRPWRNQSGRLRDEQLARAAQELAQLERSAAAGRRAPPSPDRRAVAIAQEARRAPQPRACVARRRRRRADRRRAHPPEHDRGAARVRDRHRRRARRRRVGRAGARAAAPAPPRRSARAPRLRVRRDGNCASTRTRGATAAGR